MKEVKVKELLPFSPTDPAVVSLHATVSEIVKKMIEDHRTREVYVIDEKGHFFGVITLRRLAQCVFSSEIPGRLTPTALLELVSAGTAKDLALRKPAYVHDEDDFKFLLEIMFRYDINEILVLNGEHAIVGNINMLEILSAWLDGHLDHLKLGEDT